MKQTISLRTFAIAAIFFFCAPSQNVSAQCKIMDAAVQWNSGDGTLKVFLTDIDGLAGLQIDVGESADTLTTYNTQYSITGNSFGSGGTVADNVLTVPIGNYAANSDYFIRVRVLLANSYNEIEIHTVN